MHIFALRMLRYGWVIILFLSCSETHDTLPFMPQTSSADISISSPSEGASVVDTILIRANTDRSLNISQVRFYIDGQYRFTDFRYPWEFQWDSYELADGKRHRISATGTDHYGKLFPSDPIWVTVRYPLFGIITYPDSGTSVHGTIPVRANAYHSRGIPVSRVDFYIDQEFVFSDEQPPWLYYWDTNEITDDLNHVLSCKVYDVAEKTSLSDPVVVRVKSSLIPSTYHLTFDKNDSRIDLILKNNYSGPFSNQKEWRCHWNEQWISVTPESGITNAGGWSRLTVTVDRVGLSHATQYGSLVITSGYNQTDTLAIPVKVYM